MGAVNSTEAQHAVATQNNMSIEAVLAAPPNASTVVSPLCLKYAHHLAAKSDVAPIQGVVAFSIVAFSLFAADSFYWFLKNKPWRLSSFIDILITTAGPIMICGGEIALLWLFHEVYAYHFYCEAMPDWSSYGKQTGFWITMIVFSTPLMWALLWVGAMALVLGFLAHFFTLDALDSRYPPLRTLRAVLNWHRRDYRAPALPTAAHSYPLGNIPVTGGGGGS